jgi:DNA invertase Pin-like site-specific DNA recombinase
MAEVAPSGLITGIPPSSRAAQYVRMSTDMQKYSIQNQSDAIAAYAAQRGLAIVRTYADEGRSGLNIERREALQHLIDDVKDGGADFQFVLVYDVSRWGRFQDADESAYYEFLCKEAGIRVLYCAEMFENDGSLSSTVLKSIKRAMAGEYSRELSTKVFIGQSRIARLGFWRGGSPGYGLRRQLVDERGNPKSILESGQRKSLQTDRIVLVHGPDNEVEVVRRIFRSFVNEHKGEGEIARELNADNVPSAYGKRWETETITRFLESERYIGHILFNRTSFKLGKTRVKNPSDMWIRGLNACAPIIDQTVFDQAQSILRKRRQLHADNILSRSLLDDLSKTDQEKGYLTGSIVDAQDNLPSAETLRRSFGSLMNAYRLIDYRSSRLASRKARAVNHQALVEKIANQIVAKIKRLGGHAAIVVGNQIRIEDDVSVSICIARANRDRLNRMRWYAQVDRLAKTDLTLVTRVDLSGRKVESCYLLPTVEIAGGRCSSLRITCKAFVESCRYESVEAFCEAWAHRKGQPVS